ncbi:glycoside hydrolase family 78 protein [Herbiconiux solani]|uniref:glycoside hydrolase family 78 protein n=1 Tax=Herbiconiux solani TaxID=661329 RepID=UPI0008241AED|nr:glycoside hydrolase family 78 protein [Herbiconiux solani]
MTVAHDLTPRPVDVRFEHHADGRLGIGEARPRLSWRYREAPPGFRQTAVTIEISIDQPGRDAEVSEQRITGDEQILVDWPGRTLASRERVHVRVRSESETGVSDWSDSATVELGLLDDHEWVGSFVGAAWPEERDSDRRPSRVRAEFTVPSDIVRARLYVTAHGLVQAEVNGVRVGDEELTPGWTSYHHRLRYATFDLGPQLRPGANAIGFWLSDGWWRDRIGFEGGVRDVYGHDQSVLAQIELTRSDGSVVVIGSDAEWSAGFGPMMLSSVYDGEHVDLRQDDAGWSLPGWNDPSWSPVAISDRGTAALVAPTGPPVRCAGELVPVEILEKGDGRWLIDFGQNHSGRLHVTGSSARGASIVLRHAEVIEGGELYTRTLRQAAATDQVELPPGDFSWEPRFAIHGYRYAEVTGWEGELRAENIVSRVLHTDMERIGWFESSNPAVNRLHENILWSMRSNFVDIPMDCPQRDERLGWTGDLQIFAPTASFLYSATGMLSSWLQDVAVEQTDRGTVPFYVPYLPLGTWQDAPVDPVAVWGDVAVLTPDVLHARTGDVELLRRQYASAKAWVDEVHSRAGDDLICRDTFQLGDWLDPAAPPDAPERATTDPYLVATAYFAHSARRLGVIAAAIGAERDAESYRELGEAVEAAFASRFLTLDGRADGDTQAAYALATTFRLWPTPEAERAGAARLAELVQAAEGRVETGFAGTPVVSDALTIGGQDDAAYSLLLSEECPSWLYMVRMGATTIWERWDSMLPDGTVNPGDMTSFNHYALGSVGDWLHRVVAGLAPDAPGYRRIRFAPRPGGGLRSAAARHLTPYGEAGISWRVSEQGVEVTCTVPVGSTAELHFPGAAPVELGHGTHVSVFPDTLIPRERTSHGAVQ